MKRKRLWRASIALLVAVVMLAVPAIVTINGGVGWSGETAGGNQKTKIQQIAAGFAPDVVHAAISSSKAKSIATKDAKSRYKISKAYSVRSSSSSYRGNAIWKVTFYGKKSGRKYNYIYYVSKKTAKILYRKQYL